MRSLQRILVTGGLGFIGSAFIRYLLQKSPLSCRLINLDACTYAGSLQNMENFHQHPRYRFVCGDICDQGLVEKLCEEETIDTIVHFAAETHVDRSIASAKPFFTTNVLGTLALLEAVKKFPHIHFHHVSTDEVYGSLREEGFFCESSPYRPNSPYAASKAASDHLVRSFAHTYGLSVTLSHCSNNYGPGQFPEKFIPLMIHHCIQRKMLPVYGNGLHVRDWLYVEDHVEAIWTILQKGEKGQTYNIGGNCECTNLDLLHMLISLLAQERQEDPKNYLSLIRFVPDRPGHDFRYAIDATKIKQELGWHPATQLHDGLLRTVQWFSNRLLLR